MTEKVDTLFVRNEAQVILMNKELKGQLSDGNWENEKTDSRLWYCEVKVAHSGDKLGCNWKVKHSVDFDDDFLLEVLSDRMLEYVRMTYPKYDLGKMREDLQDLTEIVFGE